MLSTDPRLLVVDSDTDGTRTLASALYARGVLVGAVKEPSQAAVAVGRFAAQALLVRLYDLDSAPQLMRQLRTDVRLAHLPLVVAREALDAQAVLDSLRDGATAVLSVPLDAEQVLSVIRPLMSQALAPGQQYGPPLGERLLASYARLQHSIDLVLPGRADAIVRFVRGELVHGQFGSLSGIEALIALASEPGASLQLPTMSRPPTPVRRPPPPPPEPEPVPHVAPPALEVDVAPAPISSGGAGLCLLVDDEPHLLKLFGTFLTRVGFTVVTAMDGEQGYNECVAQRPAVVVADLNMPRLDGWGMLRRIRTDGRIAETPLVFLSAQDDYRESLKAIGAGAQDYLAKASKMDGLAKRIREVLVPRELVQASLSGGEGAHGRAELLGVRWLLEQVAREKVTGVVALADGLGVYNVGVREGEVVFAAAKQGDRKLKGEPALEAMLEARTGDLQFVPGAAQPVTNLSGALLAMVERLAQGLHDREEKSMEQLMVKASGVEIDVGLYGLYERFSGPLARQVAGLLQSGKTPREIIVETQLSPLEVEDTLRDMVRRGVVTLSE